MSAFLSGQAPCDQRQDLALARAQRLHRAAALAVQFFEPAMQQEAQRLDLGDMRGKAGLERISVQCTAEVEAAIAVRPLKARRNTEPADEADLARGPDQSLCSCGKVAVIGQIGDTGPGDVIALAAVVKERIFGRVDLAMDRGRAAAQTDPAARVVRNQVDHMLQPGIGKDRPGGGPQRIAVGPGLKLCRVAHEHGGPSPLQPGTGHPCACPPIWGDYQKVGNRSEYRN